MKKQIALAIGLAVLSTGALASKARLEALGQDGEGSMFLDDSRNVMMNPAVLNYHKDFVTMEWGDTSSTLDSASGPRAEGGLFKAAGNMVYGIYFGNESNLSDLARLDSGTPEESNTTDFFVAGDAGVQWGARLSYEDYENKQGNDDQSASSMGIKLGIISGDIEGFLDFGLGSKAENGDDEYEGKGSMDIGITYGQGDVDYMIKVKTAAVEDEDGNEIKGSETKVAVAKTYKLNDKATMWASAEYNMNTYECDDAAFDAVCVLETNSGVPAALGGTDTAVGENKLTYLPVSIALEVIAKEWLTLRGSVTSNVMGTYENDDGDKATIADSTVVAAGATLSFGDLSFDGMIGNGGKSCINATTKAPTTENNAAAVCSGNTNSENGVLNTQNLLSRVSMTYKF